MGRGFLCVRSRTDESILENNKLADATILLPTCFSPLSAFLEAPQTFSDGLPVPKILVFDLDYTLWPFWCDTHVSPPLKVKDQGRSVIDHAGETLSFYKDVPSILSAAHAQPIALSLASRTHAPDIAEALLKMLVVSSDTSAFDKTAKKAFDLFKYSQIYPGDKRAHLKRIHYASGVAFEDILFFDDESRNRNVEGLGVCFWLVKNGVTNAEVDKGIQEWRRKRKDRTDQFQPGAAS